MPVENIHPRRQLLEIWSAVATYTTAHETWQWGGRTERNSISDAEQLLCLLQPATKLEEMRLEVPDDTADDVLRALERFGDTIEIPRRITAAIEDYLTTYTQPDGTPIFAGGSTFSAMEPDTELTEDQRSTDVIVSYALSVSLCLAAQGFLLNYLNSVTKGARYNKIVQIQAQISNRLTAALVGLLRGFTMNPIKIDSDLGRNLLAQLNQESLPPRRVVEMFNKQMATVRSRLSEARFGVTRADDLDNPNMLFEIGWTWSVADDALPIPIEDPDAVVGPQNAGVALSAPYLYFTLIALDAVEELTSDRTRILGLLNEQQDTLANYLSIRRDLTLLYWSQLARFTPASWPLENLPWLTADGVESDYFSLLVSSVLIQDLKRRTGAEDQLRRIEPLLGELAKRARITRRHLRDDPAVAIHSPGLPITLDGAEKLGPTMMWRIADFAPLLFKRVEQLAQLTNSAAVRDDLLALGTEIWNHLQRRQILKGSAYRLWDDPARVYPELGETRLEPDWTMTSRVVDALVTTAAAQTNRQTRDPRLSEIASSMVSEAEYLLNVQQMSTPVIASVLQNALQEIRESLQRAKGLIETQPSTAMSISLDAVTQLDKNMLARRDGGQVL